jgi:indolepyruvate ferredoxin oxidoreductase alpha subunit
VLPSSRLETLILGLGVDPAHFHIVDAHPKRVDENADIIRRELEHKGLSVIIAVRTCLEEARKKKKEGKVKG